MNPNEIINILQSNIQSAMPIIQVLSGCLFTTIFLRKDTSTQEFEKIKAGQFNEVINELLSSGKMTYTEFYKAKNFLSIAKIADQKYCTYKKCGKENSYDFDWFINFYETVGNVSDEKMQDLWAKILSQEIYNPNSVSLKVVDALKNMRRNEAELFEKVCNYSFIGGKTVFIPNCNEYLNNFEIQYSDILLLSEYELIYNDGSLNINFDIDENFSFICRNNEVLLIAKSADKTKKKFNIKCFPFTTTGNSIMKIIQKCASNNELLYFSKILAKNSNFIFEVHKILNLSADEFKYDNKSIL